LVTSLSGVPPLLLLDDVLAELDPQRQQLLLEAVGEGHQCLVSATHLQSCVADWQQRAQLVEVRAGALLPAA
jgi:DNA replication and repair protein RecF